MADWNWSRLEWWRKGLLVLTLVCFVAYEIAGLYDVGPDDTWSELVWMLSERSILFVLAAGITLGHFFWQRKRR